MPKGIKILGGEWVPLLFEKVAPEYHTDEEKGGDWLPLFPQSQLQGDDARKEGAIPVLSLIHI